MGRVPDCLVCVFAKAPVPGQVKTRLIPRLGAEGAARFHADCVRRTLATALEARVGTVELCCAPDSEAPFFAALSDELGIALTQQGGGNLGERMHRAIARGLQHHAHMVLIGTDCPVLEPQDLRDAALSLREHDTVFFPTEDGGYALIGARRIAPAAFANIPWSTDSVMDLTRANLDNLGWSRKELRTLWDVDWPADYDRLQQEGLCAP